MKRNLFPLVVLILVLLFLYLPIVVLTANSFNASRFGGTWEGFTLKWYQQLLNDQQVWVAFGNSLLIATGATLASCLLGTTAALALHRWHTRLQNIHYGLIYTPLVVPEILMGISLLLLFIGLKVPLGLFTVFLAHVTFCISYVAMVVLARLQDFDFTLVEAAHDLGAGTWICLRRVLLPLLAPGILAGALLAFTLSIDDFVITFFVAGPGATTLPIRVYSMIKHGATPVINALSTLLLVVTFGVVLLAQRLAEEKNT